MVFCDDAFGPQSDRWVDLLPVGCHRILPVFDGGFDAAHPTCRPRVERSSTRIPVDLNGSKSRGSRRRSGQERPEVVESVLEFHSCREHLSSVFCGDLWWWRRARRGWFRRLDRRRGVKVLRFPTTTLAQDDAGIGVKNGVNHHNEKNWQGVFAVPTAVINDFSLLSSLSDRDWRSGFR